MSVSNGQDANETTFNTAFLSRSSDTDTVGKVDLLEASTTDLIDIQRIINEALASLGVANQAATDAAADTYSSENVVTNGTDRKVAVGAIDGQFDPATGFRTVTGSSLSPTAIVAGTGVVVAGTFFEVQYIEGSGADTDISASPQVAAGTNDGDQLILRGTSNSLKVLLEDGDGLSLNGPWAAKKNSSLTLHWDKDQAIWIEAARRD